MGGDKEGIGTLIRRRSLNSAFCFGYRVSGVGHQAIPSWAGQGWVIPNSAYKTPIPNRRIA
jgi:hypothetical protein